MSHEPWEPCDDPDVEIASLRAERDEALAQVAVLVQALENVLYAQLGGHLNPTDDGKKVLNRIRPLQSQTPREARARALLDRLRIAEQAVLQPYCGHEATMLENVEAITDLTDRLQRAEKVVEAAKAGKLLAEQLADLIVREDIEDEDLREASETLLPHIYDFFLGINAALAAWEEGKT